MSKDIFTVCLSVSQIEAACVEYVERRTYGSKKQLAAVYIEADSEHAATVNVTVREPDEVAK
jgi:hypothetical protein